MSVLPIVSIALLCGIAAASAVWVAYGLCENALHTLRAIREKKAPPEEEEAEEKPRRTRAPRP